MPLSAPKDRIICTIDLQKKNFHSFSNGHVISLRRQVDNFDRKHTEPCQAICINGGSSGIPAGAEVLCHHNSAHETYRINNYVSVSGNYIAEQVYHYSLPESQVYLWRTDGDWQPLFGWATALRVFKEYKGILHGIDPKPLKDTLFITSGELRGICVHTVKAADYELVFRDRNGQEKQIIRCRHYEDDPNNNREEIIAINADITKKIWDNEYLVGVRLSDARKLFGRI